MVICPSFLRGLAAAAVLAVCLAGCGGGHEAPAPPLQEPKPAYLASQPTHTPLPAPRHPPRVTADAPFRLDAPTDAAVWWVAAGETRPWNPPGPMPDALDTMPVGPAQCLVWLEGHAPLALRVDGAARGQVFHVSPPRGVRVHGALTDANGAPLAGAVIEARRQVHKGVSLPIVQTWTSDERGVFELDTLLDGARYDLVARMPGFVARRETVVARDALELPAWALQPAARVRGRVTRDDGDPAPGARVTALHEDGVADHAVADASGAYSLNSLPPGRYQLFARDDSQAMDPHALLWRAPGESAEIDLTLHVAGSARFTLRHADNQRPVANAGVELIPLWGPPWLVQPALRATTDQDGLVGYEGLTPGPYAVGLVAEGFEPLGRRVMAGDLLDGAVVVHAPLTGEARLGPLPETRLRIRRGEALERTIALRPLPSQARAAQTGALHGRVLGPWGPLAHVPVALGEPSASNMVHTDADGAFVFAGLPAGAYQIVCLHEHLTQPTVTAARVDPLQAAVEHVIILEEGTRLTGVARARETGMAQPGVELALEHAATATRRAISDGEGRFVFEGVARGPNMLIVTRTPPGHTAPPPRPVMVDAAGMPDTVVWLNRGGSLTCRVRDQQGRAIQGALVHVESHTDEGYRREMVADYDGVAVFRDVPLDQPLLALARDVEQAPAVIAPVVLSRSASESQIELVLRPGGAIAGRLLRADGTSAEGHGVQAGAPDAPPPGRAFGVSGFDGGYLLRDVPEGMARVVAGGAQALVLVVAGQTTDGVDLVVDTPGDGQETLTGRVTFEDGSPAAGAQVELVALSTGGALGSFRRAVCDAQGHFILEGLSAGDTEATLGDALMSGTYLGLRMRAPGSDWWQDHDAPIVIPGPPVELRLRSGGRLAGVVLDAETGQPVPSFALSLPGGEQPAIWVENAYGAFALEQVRPGNRMLIVSANGYADKQAGPFLVEPDAALEDVVIALDTGQTIDGVVLDDVTTQPVPDARVQLLRHRASTQVRDYSSWTGLDGSHRPQASGEAAHTDAQGRFSIGNVVASVGLVARANHDAYAPAQSGVIVEGTAPVEIRLRPGGQIVGRVLGGDGSPRPGARVLCQLTQSRWLQPLSHDDLRFHMSADAEGAYRFARLPEGRYRLEAMLEGDQRIQRTVDVRAGEEVTADLTAETVSVSGVIYRGDQPAQGLEVALSTRANSRSPEWGVAATSDQDGRFALAGITPAIDGTTVYLLVMQEGSSLFGTPLYSRPIVLDREEITVQIDLAQAGLTGRVLDERGAPLPGVVVQLRHFVNNRYGGARIATSGSEGEFSFDVLSPGRYRVQAEAAGRHAVHNDFTFKEGDPPPALELRLASASAAVTGVARLADGAPADGAMVSIVSADDPGASPLSVPVREGRYELRRQTPGRYDMLAHHPGANAFVVAYGVQLSADAVTTHDLTLRPGKRVGFLILDENGEALPVSAMEFELLDHRGNRHPLVWPGANGYTVTVHDETYVVRVRRDGHSLLEVHYDMTGFDDGQQAELQLP